MKNLIIAVSAFLMMLNADLLAGDGDPLKPANENTYCAEMKDNVMVVIRDGEVLNHDIIFDNGVELKSDGRVVYPNGVKATMKPGECVDKSGLIIAPQKIQEAKN
jgi:hypothetical protein